MTHEETLNNRAALLPETPQAILCPACDEPLVFALEDKHHKFSIGLLTILQCLKFAETQGHIPKVPGDWWLQLRRRYKQNFLP